MHSAQRWALMEQARIPDHLGAGLRQRGAAARGSGRHFHIGDLTARLGWRRGRTAERDGEAFAAHLTDL